MRAAFLLSALILLMACNPDKALQEEDNNGTIAVENAGFVKGADISWVTEMESKGYKFYDAAGREMECTALIESLGFDAVRYRLWVNPENAWNSKKDVLIKALRAKALGMRIMIDFHYSNTWADPGKQHMPKEWEGQNVEQISKSVTEYTESSLKFLKDNGIDVSWVQLGNEVDNGMLWETGRVAGSSAENFAKYFNAACSVVRRIYPNAQVILHLSNAWKTETLSWFFDLMKANKVNYDIIGLSLYPSYWENGAYPDWNSKTQAALRNFTMLHNTYGKEVMLVEFGMPASNPEKARACLQYLIDNVAQNNWFKGIFYWEPESEESRNDYAYGAFNEGRPTSALDPFKQ